MVNKNKGWYLKKNDRLESGDYIASPDGLFIAIMDWDGNINVSYGSGAEDRSGNLWSSTWETQEGQNFYAIMHDDGNLCIYNGNGADIWCSRSPSVKGDYFLLINSDGELAIYKGTGPADNRGIHWRSNRNDPLTDIIDISSIEYIPEEAKIKSSKPTEIYRQTVKNDTDIDQESAIGGSESVTETHGWSCDVSIKVGVATTFEVGVPLVMDDKVTISAELSTTFAWNSSISRTKTWEFNTPVKVHANSAIVGLVSVTISELSVPYKLKGTGVFRDGGEKLIKINGVYDGTSAYDFQVQFAKKDPITGKIIRSS